MDTSARALATVVALVHMAFVAFVVAGGVLALRWPRVAWVHLPAALWGALIALGGYICPLTPLENWLRVRGGGTAYDTGFLEHYLLPVLYPVAMTRGLQIATGLFVVLLNALVYWRAFRRIRARWHRDGTSFLESREVKNVQDPHSRRPNAPDRPGRHRHRP
jgi:hypothetical protein